MRPTTHRTHPSVLVRRTFEATRLSPACLAEAYAALVPSVRRRVAVSRPEWRARSTGDAQHAGGTRR